MLEWMNPFHKVPNHDEDGYPYTDPHEQDVVGTLIDRWERESSYADHVPGELIIHDGDGRPFRYPL